jgi:hypothetical protein
MVMRMPLDVVRLDVGADVIRARLAGDPNASRAGDLEVALRDLETAPADPDAWSVDGAAGPAVVAAAILEHLGWPPGT